MSQTVINISNRKTYNIFLDRTFSWEMDIDDDKCPVTEGGLTRSNLPINSIKMINLYSVEVGETSNNKTGHEEEEEQKAQMKLNETEDTNCVEQSLSFCNEHFTGSASSINIIDKNSCSGLALSVILPENIGQIGGVTNDPSSSLKSATSFVCRICLNDENPDT